MKLSSVGHWQYWLVGVALVLLLLVAASFVPRYWGHAQTGGAAGDLAALRETLLAEPASVRGNWLRTLNPAVQDVQGDLVWNAVQQQGVMRFVNLPEPASGGFYQVWLYDSRSADGKPVSGATFHQGSGKGEWLALVKAVAPVAAPYKFELRLETGKAGDEPQLLLMVQP